MTLAELCAEELPAEFDSNIWNTGSITDTDEATTYTLYSLKGVGTAPQIIIPKTPGSDEPEETDKGDIIVETENNVGGAGADPEELKNAVDISETEQALIDRGEDLIIILNVQKADTVLPEDEALTESVKGDAVIGMYLDISLLKKIGNIETAVHETNEPIKISFAMPEELISTDSAATREYYIIRVHEENGVKTAEKRPLYYDSASGKYWFMTNKFSSYAIAYVDVPKTDAQVKYPIDLGNDGRVHSNANSAAAGDKITITVDPGYRAHIYSGSKEIAVISGTGSFIMPANSVKIVIECELGQYMLTKARSYVYSYTSDMDYITVNATKNQKSTVTIDLGKDYAGKSFVIYEGKKSTKVKVTEGVLDNNGKFTLEVDFGKNYTLVVED